MLRLRNILSRNPLIFQCIQASVLVSTSDIIAQKFVQRNKHFNLRRTLEFACIGFFMIGPSAGIWYRFLHKKFSGEQNKLKRLAKKIFFDQLIYAPIYTVVYIVTISLIQGNRIMDIKKRLEDNYFTIQLNSYKLWPFAQVINFTLVPLKYRVLFAQCVALMWNTYLSNKLCKRD